MNQLQSKINDYLILKDAKKAQETAMLWASETPSPLLVDQSVCGDKFNRIDAMIRVACKRELRSRGLL